MSCLNLYLGNNNVIELQNLTNSATGVVDTGATVNVTLKDNDGNNVTGESWPVSMPHVSNGLYRGVLSDGINIQSGQKYFAVIDAVGSGSEIGYWETEVNALVRN